MSQTPSTSDEPFDLLRRRGRDLAAHGRFEEALDIFNQASAWVEQHGDAARRDLAFLNRAAVLVAMGRGGEVVGHLRRLLLASADSAHRHLAAYNVSLFYEREKDAEKGLRYGRLALDHAERTESRELIARSHNRIANALIAQSYFSEARDHYLPALEMWADEDSIDRAFILDNLGYCHVVTGSTEAGFRSLFASLRLLRRLGAGQWESFVHLDLCYAYLDLERFDHARRHGLAALRLAEARGQDAQVKNSLYLLGEIAKHDGDRYSAYDYFTRLQDEFYPDNGSIVGMLMAIDARRLINLKA